MDDFVIQFCQGLKVKDFTVKNEGVSRKRKGKREYLNNVETRRMMNELERYFESKVEIRRGVLDLVPLLVDRRVFQPEVGREVDDYGTGIQQRGRDRH